VWIHLGRWGYRLELGSYFGGSMIRYHCFRKTKLNQFDLQSSHTLTQKLGPSTARLGTSNQGPPVNLVYCGVYKRLTPCLAVLTQPAQDGRDYRRPGPWRWDEMLWNTGRDNRMLSVLLLEL